MPHTNTISDVSSLVDTVDFSLVGSRLGRDVESALQAALAGGSIFSNGSDPLIIFRQALATSIRNIESHPRGRLFQEFLLKGPYENNGDIPAELADQRLSDSQCASAITFIYSHMVNSFKGAITELLAAKACQELVSYLKKDGALPEEARLYVGDAVMVHQAKGKGLLKGADMYILVRELISDHSSSISIAGVFEVKSYIRSKRSLLKQLHQHILRSAQGLRVDGVDYPTEKVNIGYRKSKGAVLVSVLPSNWKLPRAFRFENNENGRLLHVEPGIPPMEEDTIAKTGDHQWHITLRWSREALAEAAYEMTFWYMEKIGEVIYSEMVPKVWEKMTPAEAGRNAAKMMLYYAILRSRSFREEQRAISLYNTYGFGYALGMNYKDKEGRHEMLWPQDLDEILSAGKTANDCTIK